MAALVRGAFSARAFRPCSRAASNALRWRLSSADAPAAENAVVVFCTKKGSQGLELHAWPCGLQGGPWQAGARCNEASNHWPLAMSYYRDTVLVITAPCEGKSDIRNPSTSGCCASCGAPYMCTSCRIFAKSFCSFAPARPGPAEAGGASAAPAKLCTRSAWPDRKRRHSLLATAAGRSWPAAVRALLQSTASVASAVS